MIERQVKGEWKRTDVDYRHSQVKVVRDLQKVES
jgi:hypothetical protein